MEWGIGIILVLLLLIGYVILQETRAQMHWRDLVAQGDTDAIRKLIESEIEAWHSQRVPKGTPALLWHGVQTVELLDVDSTSARVSCHAEGEHTLVDGRRVETSSPLAEGMKITKQVAEMMLYDIPNVKLDQAQIDVYTSFRSEGGHAEPRCILSTQVPRHSVEHIDWDETEAGDFIQLTQGRFGGNGNGIRPVEPLLWPGPSNGAGQQQRPAEAGDDEHTGASDERSS